MNPSLAARGPSAQRFLLGYFGMPPLFCHGVPSGVAASSHPLGRGVWALSQSSALAAAWGCSWDPLGIEVSLSDSTEAWETPAQARVFLPWLLAQLTGKAEGNSPEWKLCGQKFC